MTGWHILAIVAISTPVLYGLIELAAARLFDHVDRHGENDEDSAP